MKVRNLILPALLIILIWSLRSSPVQNFYWMTIEFLNPHFGAELERKWQNKTSDFLLRKLYSNNYFYPGVAARVLVARKDKTMVPIYLTLLNSKNAFFRGTIINALGEIGDQRAIVPLKSIVENGNCSSPNYMNALLALAKIKYQPIFKNILDLMNSRDQNDRSFSINMLQAFGNEESIKLIKMIAATDKESIIRDEALRALYELAQKK